MPEFGPEFLAGGAEAAREKTKLLAPANVVKDVIESSEYVAGVPLDVRVNQEMRQYKIRWKELEDFKFNGKELLRTVPFVPRMRIVVSARYEPQKQGGSYGYRITNGAESETNIRRFGVECRGLTGKPLAEIQGLGRMVTIITVIHPHSPALPESVSPLFLWKL